MFWLRTVRRLLVLGAAASALGAGWLTTRVVTQDVTVTLSEAGCRQQRLANRNPATRVELKSGPGAKCRVERVDVVEWTDDRAGYVRLKSHGSETFSLRLKRDMVEGFGPGKEREVE
ncbi:MAG: hypothetical protein ACJ74Q_15465 [Pyrinomonadaceae bacterium]